MMKQEQDHRVGLHSCQPPSIEYIHGAVRAQLQPLHTHRSRTSHLWASPMWDHTSPLCRQAPPQPRMTAQPCTGAVSEDCCRGTPPLPTADSRTVVATPRTVWGKAGCRSSAMRHAIMACRCPSSGLSLSHTLFQTLLGVWRHPMHAAKLCSNRGGQAPLQLPRSPPTPLPRPAHPPAHDAACMCATNTSKPEVLPQGQHSHLRGASLAAAACMHTKGRSPNHKTIMRWRTPWHGAPSASDTGLTALPPHHHRNTW
jgi:hypothetical protein